MRVSEVVSRAAGALLVAAFIDRQTLPLKAPWFVAFRRIDIDHKEHRSLWTLG
jgi:hypothetical protein